MSKEALEKAHAALKRMASYGNTFGYRSNEQNPYEEVCEAIAAIDALADKSAQQEPVAVVSGYYGGKCVILPIDPARIYNSNTPLYTSPPAQRKPLTDEQIWREYRFLWPFHPKKERKLASDILEFARAIEAAHGIKENT